MFFFCVRKLREIGSGLLDALAPPSCPVTDEPVAAPGLVSASAWARINFIEDPVCACCGAPFSVAFGEATLCAGCIADPPDFDSARAGVVYDDASHALIIAFKHSDRTDLAPLFARWLAGAGRLTLTKDALVAPVPLHWRRLFARRYNQAALLARLLAGAVGAEFAPDLLARTRPTPPQKNLSGEARRRNVAGAFTLSPGAAMRIAGRSVVIVDDVLTTGATLSACARALKKAGAARVDALAIARVVRGGVAVA
jgi:ComF family protein